MTRSQATGLRYFCAYVFPETSRVGTGPADAQGTLKQPVVARWPSLGPFWGQGGVEFLAWHQERQKKQQLAPELEPLVDVGCEKKSHHYDL